MNCLALDLGTKTGYAGTLGGGFIVGTWVLASPKTLKEQAKERFDRRLDCRIPTLFDSIVNINQAFPLDWIFFEDVTFSTTTLQVQLWSSLRAAVWLFADLSEGKTKIECCPVSTLKKFGADYGGATKEQMAKAAYRKYPKWVRPDMRLTDDAIDATHLLAWGAQIVSRG